MRYSLNSFKGGYMGNQIGYDRGCNFLISSRNSEQDVHHVAASASAFAALRGDGSLRV